jgi:adenosylcobinamide kinase/adenosylcobinamide-phosphate guanylyltransferase
MLTLILGGIRSGKSRTAAALATGRVVVVATGQPTDAEMAARIAEHRRLRPPEWVTLEEPLRPAAAPIPPDATVLLDSVDSLVANWLLGGASAAEAGKAAVAEVLGIAAAGCIAVSCEAGMAPVALSPLGRAFQDALGRVNQALAARADRGIPVTLK